MSTAIELPEDLLMEMREAAREGGFGTADQFVRWAVEDKLRDLRRDLFYTISDEVKRGLAERGHTPEEVLEDFERGQRCGWSRSTIRCLECPAPRI